MIKYPIGVQSFKKLRETGYVYVDKTKYIYNLVNGSSNCVFLSRPRRFGKSLLLSTLEAYFKGQKELFTGLAIEKLEKEWKHYPTIRIDLNIGKFDSVKNLQEVLDNNLYQYEKIYGVEKDDASISIRFHNLIQRVCEQAGLPVVILIDEYDKPLLNSIENLELNNALRTELKAFYSVLKAQDQYIRFAFITGVTKFSKVSIFSDLNNLKDISLYDEYACLCGITESELVNTFPESIHRLAEKFNMTDEQMVNELRKQYDGYHFAPGAEGVYNPFSLIYAFDSLTLGDYWYQTGTPTFLVKLLQEQDYLLNEFFKNELATTDIMGKSNFFDNPIPVLYQSGYLTIKDYDPLFKSYFLGFPNREVELGFSELLTSYYFPSHRSESEFSVQKFVESIWAGDVEYFLKRLNALFADTTYQLQGNKEIYWQNSMVLVFRMMGFYVQAEFATSSGRMDAVVQTKDFIYIFEIKYGRTAEEALAQIEEKQYAAPFAMDGRKLFKIGVNFEPYTRTITYVYRI